MQENCSGLDVPAAATREGAGRRATPRYLELARRMIRDIGAGKYVVGEMLPTEFELAEAHGLSRHTVREAIRHVCSLGLITRQPGVGTRVIAREPRPPYVAGLNALSDIVQYATETRLEFVAKAEITADADRARQLRCAQGDVWVLITALRFAPSQAEAITYIQMYFPPTLRDIWRHVGNGNNSIMTVLEQVYGERVVEVEQEVGAVLVAPEAAALFAVEPYSPALQTRRIYIGAQDRPISFGFSVFPQGRFSFVSRWCRDTESTAV